MNTTDTTRTTATPDNHEWLGDATSVIEFLRPLREHLDAPGVLEVCVNRPGELMIETHDGWHAVSAPQMTLERCLSLATAVGRACYIPLGHKAAGGGLFGGDAIEGQIARDDASVRLSRCSSISIWNACCEPPQASMIRRMPSCGTTS